MKKKICLFLFAAVAQFFSSFAGGTALRNPPSECKAADSACGCATGEEVSDGEPVGVPDPGLHSGMDERLLMVDAAGWACTNAPVYYDLHEADGTGQPAPPVN